MLLADQLKSELTFRAGKSSGPGGQHVNKVSTRITLLFNVLESALLSEYQKGLILEKLSNRISLEGILSLHCDETRSQVKNKEIVYVRFVKLIEEALKPVKKRKPTRPTKSSVEKRLRLKKHKSEKKNYRKYKTDD